MADAVAQPQHEAALVPSASDEAVDPPLPKMARFSYYGDSGREAFGDAAIFSVSGGVGGAVDVACAEAEEIREVDSRREDMHAGIEQIQAEQQQCSVNLRFAVDCDGADLEEQLRRHALFYDVSAEEIARVDRILEEEISASVERMNETMF